MNKKIASYILNYRWWLRAKGIRPVKWRKIISQAIFDSGWMKVNGYTANDFVETWESLEKGRYL